VLFEYRENRDESKGVGPLASSRPRERNPFPPAPLSFLVLFLAQAHESPAFTPASAATSALVAILALAMAVVAFRARAKRGNKALTLVAWAFVVFALKNVFSGYNVVAHERAAWPSVPHDEIELILSLFDLVIMLFLFAPFLLRRGRA